MTVRVGDPAPDFALPLVPGEAPLRLDDYHGEKSVVILFFPLAFSPVCTTELKDVAADYATWLELDAVVVGISVDSPFVNRRFAKELEVPFPIVSDFNRETAAQYGVLVENYFGMKGVSRRSAFVIDRSGKVAFTWIAEDDEPPELDDILAAVRTAK